MKQFNFYYDAMPPVVTSSLNGDFFVKDGRTYMAKNASFALAATDNKAGVKEIFHSINGGTLQLYSAPVSLPKQGAYNVKFKSVDLVNNQTGLLTNDQLKNIFMDDTAPTIGHSFKGPKYLTRDTVFITKETLVQLFATDNESGVLKIEYQSDANGMQTYTAPFNESMEGFHAIKFSGTDQVKNIRNDQFFYIVA